MRKRPAKQGDWGHEPLFDSANQGDWGHEPLFRDWGHEPLFDSANGQPAECFARGDAGNMPAMTLGSSDALASPDKSDQVIGD